MLQFSAKKQNQNSLFVPLSDSVTAISAFKQAAAEGTIVEDEHDNI